MRTRTETWGPLSRDTAPLRRRNQRGLSIVWVTLGLAALTAFCSLAVDVGNVQVAKTELRHAVDAAARQAALGLATSGPALARSNAVAAAADNKIGGETLVLDPNQDVEFGRWDEDARTFTVYTGASEASATAVRVTARRTKARGKAHGLALGKAFGMPSVDLTGSATARINKRVPGIVGLDSITMSGSAGIGNRTNSYRSKSGAFVSGTTATYNRGTIASNGNISLSGNSQISGDARPGPGKVVTTIGGSGVSGSTSALSKALDYPMQVAVGFPGYYHSSSYDPDGDGDVTIGSGNHYFPGGTFYVRNWNVGSAADIHFSGPVTLYVMGNLTFDGDVQTFNNNPSNFRIFMCTAGTTVRLGSSSNIYADIYAPGSAFQMGGNSALCGSVVAKSVDMGGSAAVIFDESLTISLPAISLVR